MFSPIATFIILSVLKLFFGDLRVGEEDEVEGLDLSQHSESAYGFASGSSFLPKLGHAVHGHATAHATAPAAVRAS